MNKAVRAAKFTRTTKETDIRIELNLDGTGVYQINTGIGFFDHMLTALARHSGFDLVVTCAGDLQVDGHHTVEDVGICLGQALRQCIGDGAGIARYGDACIPMYEALVHAVMDISGRGFLAHNLELPQERVGQFDTCLVEEFLRAFAVNAGLTLHARQLAGTNSHHIIEALFKALAHALRQAVMLTDEERVLSTKGKLDL